MGIPRIALEDRGETIHYVGRGRELWIGFTWARGHRLFTSTVLAARGEPALSSGERIAVVRDLCTFLVEGGTPLTCVIESDDADRPALEACVRDLAAAGLPLRVKLDSPARRRAAEDQRMLRTLREGWKVTIGTRTFETVDEYRAWMRDRDPS